MTDTLTRKPRTRSTLEPAPEFRVLTTPALEVRKGQGKDSGLSEVTGLVIRYGVPYEVHDAYGAFTETIHPGACTDLLARGDLDARFLLNHKDLPLARTGADASLELTETDQGLAVRALVDTRMSAANDLVVALERGTVTQMSVGMEVDPDNDKWTGEDKGGMPNVRNIYRLRNVFDASAVTFPASPTTSIELARRAWSAIPVESRERTRKLWTLAREGRKGTLSQADSDTLMHLLEELHSVDRGEPVAEGREAAPESRKKGPKNPAPDGVKRWGFDIDDTITAAPNQLPRLAAAIRAQGDEVWVITGHGPVDARAELLDSLAFPYDQIVVVEPGIDGKGKAKVIRQNDIWYMFDNVEAFGDQIVKECPVTFQFSPTPSKNPDKNRSAAFVGLTEAGEARIEFRNDPTDEDKKVTKAIGKAAKAISKALTAQAADPDNNTDPVDADVLAALQSAQSAITNAATAQGKDNATDGAMPNVGDRARTIDIDLELARLRSRRQAA